MTVFVAGIHGVGKTYLCESFSKSTGVKHRSASSLIRAEREHADWGVNKFTRGIDENQSALIAAVRRCLSDSPYLLLDGHFVLKDSQGNLVRLATDIFESLSITAVILVENSHETIAARLAARDGTLHPGDINASMLAERQQANIICGILGIPLIQLTAPTLEEFNHIAAPLFREY
ncbi:MULTISPECIES: ATP-binding protein [unclassified Pseudomonas]|uniref:ATP-binding protein n=1 Tax=unclassified Pseudomonas TaxID=196821 RepID=UPI000D376E39|nr:MULTISPECIES: ATP-binding protein [unclassified Pseudomonas]RAU48782.1 AAA family ATPase [Pseudomonas sp. RIT 409]RAU53958.1 AAA family ATPase [Pseudomonas sp. RIT 412]